MTTLLHTPPNTETGPQSTRTLLQLCDIILSPGYPSRRAPLPCSQTLSRWDDTQTSPPTAQLGPQAPRRPHARPALSVELLLGEFTNDFYILAPGHYGYDSPRMEKLTLGLTITKLSRETKQNKEHRSWEIFWSCLQKHYTKEFGKCYSTE